MIRQKKFNNFYPSDINQIIRGKIFYHIDCFMSYNYANLTKTSPAIILVYELLYDFIEFVIDYLKFFKENQYLVFNLIKF